MAVPLLSRLTRLQIGIIVAVDIFAILAFGWWYLGGARSPTIPGTLVLSIPGWTAPSGEKFFGIIEYAPSTGAAASLLDFTELSGLSVAATELTTPLSADGTKALAARSFGGTLPIPGYGGMELVAVSLATKEVNGPLATSGAGEIIGYPVFSPDGAYLAYGKGTPLPLLPPAPDGKPYFTIDRNGIPALRDGFTVPDEYASSVYITTHATPEGVPRGEIKIAAPAAVPVAFSPDAKKLLIFDRKGLEFVSQGDPPAVATASGFPSHDGVPRIRVSPDRQYLAAQDKSGAITLYTIDWQGGMVLRVWDLNAPQSVQIGFAKNSFIVLDFINRTAYRYAPTKDGSFVAKGNVALPDFPAGTSLIGWRP